jgi:hypothetical protein
MLRVTYTRRGSRTTSSENRRLSKELQRILKRSTPRDTGKLIRGWKVQNYNHASFAVEDAVVYGYWVDQGNTRGLVGREFVEKGINKFESWYSSQYGHDISVDYRVKVDRREG